LVGWSMLHCTNAKKTSRVPKPLTSYSLKQNLSKYFFANEFSTNEESVF